MTTLDAPPFVEQPPRVSFHGDTHVKKSGCKKELINDSAKWGCRRRKVNTYKHPPPLIEYGRPIVTIETGSQRAKPVPD